MLFLQGEREITGSEFMRRMCDMVMVRAECDGCCNVMRFHGYMPGNANVQILEIESVVDNGVPSMVFYDRSE